MDVRYSGAFPRDPYYRATRYLFMEVFSGGRLENRLHGVRCCVKKMHGSWIYRVRMKCGSLGGGVAVKGCAWRKRVKKCPT